MGGSIFILVLKGAKVKFNNESIRNIISWKHPKVENAPAQVSIGKADILSYQPNIQVMNFFFFK